LEQYAYIASDVFQSDLLLSGAINIVVSQISGLIRLLGSGLNNLFGFLAAFSSVAARSLAFFIHAAV
jgi:hypothetical protein